MGLADARLLRAGNVAGLASAGQAVAYPDPQYSPRMPTTREDIVREIAAKHTSTFMQLAGSPFETEQGFAVPRYGALTVLSHQTLQTSFELRLWQEEVHRFRLYCIGDSTRWTARLAPVIISEQVVLKSDTMLVCLPSSLEDARVDFLAAVRSFVQIAQFALKAVMYRILAPFPGTSE